MGLNQPPCSLRRGQKDRSETPIPDQVKMPTSHWMYRGEMGMPRGNVAEAKDRKPLNHKILMFHESLGNQKCPNERRRRKTEGLGSSLKCPVLNFLQGRHTGG